MLWSIQSVYLYVLLLLMTKIMCSQSLCSCNETDLDFASGVNLLYHKCNNETPATIPYSITVPEPLLSELNTDIRTIFYIFGYLEFPEDSNVQLMMKALCYEQTDNVILLDWSKYSNGTYSTVFRNAERVGSLFAESIRKLVNSGLDVSKIYVIGHSLGAHIAGFVGKCNDFKIYRITGLDPANHIFYLSGCYLTPNDAVWVDSIHTDMGLYGTLQTTRADYYVNGGIRPQPGCKLLGIPLTPTDLCSHQKSVVLYAKTKYDRNRYVAMECPSYLHYLLQIISHVPYCKSIKPIGIGYTATEIRGSFFFIINDI